eukprot:scaffold7933_cov186-Ochromonas_danica.AAC.1
MSSDAHLKRLVDSMKSELRLLKEKNADLIKIQDVEAQIKKLERVYTRNCYINELKERKRMLSSDIYELENNTEELDYFDNTLDILEEHHS